MLSVITAATLSIGAIGADVVSVTPFEAQGFRAQVVVEIAAPVEEVFEAATGDVTGWWDHILLKVQPRW